MLFLLAVLTCHREEEGLVRHRQLFRREFVRPVATH
jgi:hypothetical protein